jgi:hypothetical protein
MTAVEQLKLILDRWGLSPERQSLIAAAIREAILTERAACAQLAERTGRLHPLFADQQLQQAIAAAIRLRPTP